MKDLTSLMRTMGLSGYEARIYLSLLAHGQSGASALSADSGVPHPKVYGALESLIRKGFVSVTMQKPRRWTARPPEEVFAGEIDRKIADLRRLKKEVRQLEHVYEKMPEDPVFVMKGKANFYRLVHLLPDPQHTSYRFKWTFEWRRRWGSEDRERLRRGVDLRSLGPVNAVTKPALRKWLPCEPGIREFPNEGVPISIRDDGLILISLVSSDTLLVIRDKPFVKLMTDLFRAAWKQAKPITPARLR